VNWTFLRREWGAVTFVLTVIVGMVVVPLALYFTNQGPSPVPFTTTPTPSATATASSTRASGVTP
jgi:hypothetical protein